MDSPPGLPTVGQEGAPAVGPGRARRNWVGSPPIPLNWGAGEGNSLWRPKPDRGEASAGQESGLWVQLVQAQTTSLETAVLFCPGHGGQGRGSPERGPGWGKERR